MPALRSKHLLALLLPPLALSSFSANAQRTDEDVARVISWENDTFARGRTTDRWYTNGFHYADARLRLVTDPAKPAAKMLLDPAGQRSEDPVTVFLFGQNMYTPRFVADPAPQTNDRPWGGFLYLGAGAAEYFGDWHRAVDVKVGVIGPASLAEQTQKVVHKVFDAQEPLGWDNQLRPRLGAQATYAFAYRVRGLGLDALGLQPYAKATLGNTKVLGTAGASLILGERNRIVGAPDEGDFLAVDLSQPGNYLPPPFNSLTFVAQAQISAVARNYFVTGSTFGTRSDIRLRRYVATVAVGVGWQVCKALRIDYNLKRRGPEFESSDSRSTDLYQRYGEIRVTWR